MVSEALSSSSTLGSVDPDPRLLPQHVDPLQPWAAAQADHINASHEADMAISQPLPFDYLDVCLLPMARPISMGQKFIAELVGTFWLVIRVFGVCGSAVLAAAFLKIMRAPPSIPSDSVSLESPSLLASP